MVAEGDPSKRAKTPVFGDFNLVSVVVFHSYPGVTASCDEDLHTSMLCEAGLLDLVVKGEIKKKKIYLQKHTKANKYTSISQQSHLYLRI